MRQGTPRSSVRATLAFGTALTAGLLTSLAACSVPEPVSLDCADGQSIFECKARFSDDKSRTIVFVDAALEGQPVLDTTTTKDDFGNLFCVTLYENATATYVPGECGAVSNEASVDTTTADPTAVPASLSCTDGQSVYTCQGVFSDGSLRALAFAETAPADHAVVQSIPTKDDFGNLFCVTLYANAAATFKPGEC
jgi:hypothetical protein